MVLRQLQRFAVPQGSFHRDPRARHAPGIRRLLRRSAEPALSQVWPYQPRPSPNFLTGPVQTMPGLLRTMVVIAIAIAAPLSQTRAQDIKVTLLGTGTPILNINRFGMSTLVEAGDQKLLFDIGRGAAMRLHQV